jgi:hypothetical protein
VRTPFLRLRLPVVIHRVQRGEAKLAINAARLGEYLKLAPEDLDLLSSLLPVMPHVRTKPVRKTIDYVALKAQYERLLSNGTCATQADLARHLGISRVWVSRVQKRSKGQRYR